MASSFLDTTLSQMDTNLALDSFYQVIEHHKLCTTIGRFTRVQGKTGGLLALFFAPYKADFWLSLPALFVQNKGINVPYIVECIEPFHAQAYLRLQMVDSRTKAYEMCKRDILVPSDLVENLTENGLAGRIIGYKVKDIKLGYLGKVEQLVQSMPDSYLLSLDHQGLELLIPYTKPFVIEVCQTDQTLITHLPEGYLEAIL